MDLVKIAPQAKPPVCKIMDYGKFRFEQAKREKEARKNQRVVEIKEIRLTPNIDIGDLNTKVKKRLPLPAGRQQGQGFGSLPWPRGHARVAWSGSAPCFAELCSECSTVEKQPKLEGRQMLMFLRPQRTSKTNAQI